MKNKSIIVLLVILLILSFGYIAYDKFVVQKDLNKEIADLKDKINLLGNSKTDVDNNTENNSNNVSNDNSCPKYMEAEFYGENVSGINNIHEVLKLHNDGKYQNYYENSGYFVEGTYEIVNGKISLTVTSGGSMGNPAKIGASYTYEINDNCSTINKDGDVKTLTRK